MLLLRGVAITRRDCFKLKPRRVLVQPGPEHILDLFQIAIRIEQLSDRSREGIIAKAAILRELSRINWFLWHGNVVRVNDTPSALMDDIDGAREESRQSGRPPQVVLRKLFAPSMSLTPTLTATPVRSSTTASGIAVANESRPVLSNCQSISRSPNVSSRNSKCDGYVGERVPPPMRGRDALHILPRRIYEPDQIN
jgi:hypothetical protein